MSSHAATLTRKVSRKSDRESDDRGEPRSNFGQPASSSRTSTRRSGAGLGGEPRVSLLPPEVNDIHKLRAVRRRLALGIFGVMVLVGLGILGAFVLAASSQAALVAARVTSQDLVAQEAQFIELRQVKAGIALAQAGQLVGASTEIDWRDYLQKLQATLPAGVTLNTVEVESASPFEDFAQSSVPLEGSRVATLSFAAISPTLPSIPSWLNGLSTLNGFADAVPDSVAIQPDGSYLVNITMHINSDAFSLRYAEATE